MKYCKQRLTLDQEGMGNLFTQEWDRVKEKLYRLVKHSMASNREGVGKLLPP